MAHEGPLQRIRRTTANRISKKWTIARHSKRPRGFQNGGNNCYRIGALQPLLHLPRFVNWIKKHNPKGVHWPCNPDDLNRRLPDDELVREVLLNKNKNIKKKDALSREEDAMQRYTGCVPCILKRLVVAYWGNGLIGNAPEFTPVHFPHAHAVVFPLHQLAERWFCTIPPGHSDMLDALPGTTSQAVKDKKTRNAMENYMDRQQDTDEFQMFVFDGVVGTSDDNPTPAAAKILAEYSSLFQVNIRRVLTCTGEKGCGGHPETFPQDHFGLRLKPLPSGTDTLDTAIGRAFRDVYDGAGCFVCKQKGITLSLQISIVSTPEYLRILLELNHTRTVLDNNGEEIKDDNGDPMVTDEKIRNPNFDIPNILDITQHMDLQDDDAWPVQYKLISAIYHEGEGLHSGHYTSGVTGPRQPFQSQSQFWCNDHEITDWAPPAQQNAMTTNPVKRSGLEFNPYILWYERIPHAAAKKAKGKISTADTLAMHEANEFLYPTGTGRRQFDSGVQRNR